MIVAGLTFVRPVPVVFIPVLGVHCTPDPALDETNAALQVAPGRERPSVVTPGFATSGNCAGGLTSGTSRAIRLTPGSSDFESFDSICLWVGALLVFGMGLSKP